MAAPNVNRGWQNMGSKPIRAASTPFDPLPHVAHVNTASGGRGFIVVMNYAKKQSRCDASSPL